MFGLKRAVKKTGPRVVIVGGNTAGMSAARKLPPTMDVTVVDPAPHFEWLPNIHELVSGMKKPQNLRHLKEQMLARMGHSFVSDWVDEVDGKSGRITLHSGQVLPFDVCLVAVGGVQNTQGVPGAREHALPFKSVFQCTHIAKKLAKLHKAGKVFSVVVVGGGLEGIEAAGEILRKYRHSGLLDLHIVEAAERVLPTAPASVDQRIQEASVEADVNFHLGARVTHVDSQFVTLDNGEQIKNDVVIWSGGTAPPPLLSVSGLSETEVDWAPVESTLQSAFHDNIFVIGDAAGVGDHHGKQAYHAMDMGELVADNVQSLLAGQSHLESYMPKAKPQLITYGDLDTVLVFNRFAVAGNVLGHLKEALYHVNMAKFNPPRGVGGVLSMYGRMYDSLFTTVLPNITDREILKRWPNVRLLS